MRKLIIGLLVLISAGYLAGNYWLNKQAEIYAPKIRASLEAHGIEFEQLDYGKLSINSWSSVSIHDVEATFLLDRSLYGRDQFDINLSIDKLIIRDIDFTERTVRLDIDDFDIEVISEQGQLSDTARLTEAEFTHDTPISIGAPEIGVQDILKQLGLLLNGKGAHGVSLSGTTRLPIGGKDITLDVQTIEEEGQVFLSFDPEDVTAAAKLFGVNLGSAEAEIIARHPYQVPAMIEITKAAKDKSRAHGRKDKDFPEDAYRHVYWSYHLTRELGPTLAQEITDAHETVTGNTKAERAMDFHNNEIAREIAGRKLSDTQLVQFVMTSSQVIRQPAED